MKKEKRPWIIAGMIFVFACLGICIYIGIQQVNDETKKAQKFTEEWVKRYNRCGIDDYDYSDPNAGVILHQRIQNSGLSEKEKQALESEVYNKMYDAQVQREREELLQQSR